MTERIRQFHFQTMVFRVPQILLSLDNDEAKAAFVFDRNAWFAGFKARFDGKVDAEFTNTVEDEKGADIWLHEARRGLVTIRETEDLDPLFSAYRELRIMHQLAYANLPIEG